MSGPLGGGIFLTHTVHPLSDLLMLLSTKATDYKSNNNMQ